MAGVLRWSRAPGEHVGGNCTRAGVLATAGTWGGLLGTSHKSSTLVGRAGTSPPGLVQRKGLSARGSSPPPTGPATRARRALLSVQVF